MIKKISRYTLQQIFIESLEECDSFRIIDGLNPFHIMLNGKELYIYIKNLSPAYFTNPDVWRVQLPKKEEFDTIKEGEIDFVLLGYDADNDVYTTWHPKWTKQRLNNGESVSFYSRLSLQEEVASSQDIKRLSLNNDGEVIAFPREHLEFILSNLKTFFQDDSDYVAMGSKRRPEANDAYKTFCDTKNVELLARSMTDDGYSGVTIGNYCRAIKTLINDGHITRYRKIFLSCDSLSEYLDIVSEFCNQPDIKEQNEKWHNTLSAALRAYISFLVKQNYTKESTPIAAETEMVDYLDILVNRDIFEDFGSFLFNKGYNPSTVGHYQKAIRILRDLNWLNQYKTLFEDCVSIEDLQEAFTKFFAIPEIDEFNKAKHRDFSAMSKQLIQYIDHVCHLSGSIEDEDTPQNDNNATEATVNISTENVDWEAMFTDANGKLTRIANPALLDKLRPHLDSEYVNPVCAYSEIEDFYGERYSTMDMGEWMRLFKAIDWNNPYVSLSPTKENKTTERAKSKTEILRVEYPDGRVVQYQKAVDTFVEIIENNYPDLIHELNILHANVNLVTKERSQQYASAQREIADGWLVFTNINTRRKREDLIKISNELELDLKVDIVSVATGEIINLEDEPSTSTRQKIKVTFPDCRTIQPNKVLETLVEVVKYAGPKYSIPGSLGISALNEADIPTQELYDQFDNRDLRKKTNFKTEFAHLKTGEILKSSIPLSGKFWVEGLETGDRCDVNMHIIRYADAILMYAEALNEVGESTKALAMLNRIRERAFGDDSGNFKPMSKDEFRTAILNERRLEFPHEGHRWFDLVRTGTFIQRMKEHSAYEAKVAEANKTEIAQNIKEHMILMPIPQSEIDLNPNLVQNAGY